MRHRNGVSQNESFLDSKVKFIQKNKAKLKIFKMRQSKNDCLICFVGKFAILYQTFDSWDQIF